MSQSQALPTTTPDRLREVIAETIQIDAQGLQAAIGKLVVATSAEYPEAPVDARSVHHPAAGVTVLLADRILGGQEAQALALAKEIARHHGRDAALAVLGERADELLGREEKMPIYCGIDTPDIGKMELRRYSADDFRCGVPCIYEYRGKRESVIPLNLSGPSVFDGSQMLTFQFPNGYVAQRAIGGSDLTHRLFAPVGGLMQEKIVPNTASHEDGPSPGM